MLFIALFTIFHFQSEERNNAETDLYKYVAVTTGYQYQTQCVLLGLWQDYNTCTSRTLKILLS